jgi:cysteinyl-tRNA synthetase
MRRSPQRSRRAEAKKARNFAESDKIRADLLAQGIILEDKPDGTTNWRRA